MQNATSQDGRGFDGVLCSGGVVGGRGPLLKVVADVGTRQNFRSGNHAVIGRSGERGLNQMRAGPSAMMLCQRRCGIVEGLK